MLPKFLLTLLIVLTGLIRTDAQVSLNNISLDSLFRYTEQKPEKGYEELIRRRDQSIARNEPRKRYELAKYLARYGYLTGDNPLTEQFVQEVDSLAEQLPAIEFDKDYHNFRIAFALANKDIQKAIDLLSEIHDRVMQSRDTTWQTIFHCQSARAYGGMDDHAVALKHLLKAEQLNEHFSNELLQAAIYTAYASVYWEQQEHQKAYDMDLRAMNIYEQNNSYRNLLPVYTNLISKALHFGKKKEAIQFANKYDALKKKYGSKVGYFVNELNRIFFYIELEEYQLAETQALKTIKLAKKMHRDSSHALYLLGITYRGLDRYDLAARYIEKAFNIGRDMQNNGKCAFYSHALYQTYYWDYKYAPALLWYQTHIEFRDSVYNEKKAKEIAIYESKLESLENRRKVEELEARAEVDRQQNRLLWVCIISGGLLALALLYAQRQRAHKEQLRQNSLLEKARLEKAQLEQQLEFKQREITSRILHMTRKNALLQEIREDISDLENEQNRQSVSKLDHLIRRNLDHAGDWDAFLQAFNSVHSSFLNRLRSLSGSLTANEIRLASLMKMNMSSKEIATMLNISADGVKKARYRLRKKLNLTEGEQGLQEFLLGL